MVKLRECPFCGGEALLRERYINGVANTKHYRRECRHCKATFSHWFRSVKKADEAWNRRAQPENEPITNDALTRDELYYLDGEPLYVMDGEGHECYCVVNTKNEDCIDNEAGAWCFEFYDMTGDGKHGLHKIGWRAYRTKPERSE